MRHGMSDPARSGTDFERTLNDRGRESLQAMGQWLRAADYTTDMLFSSPAGRAAETAATICPYLRFAATSIRWERGLYLASLENLLSFLREWLKTYRTVMVVGHNPGLGMLLRHMASPATLEGNSALLPTAGFVHLEVTLDTAGMDVSEWIEHTRARADLKVLMHPETLEK